MRKIACAICAFLAVASSVGCRQSNAPVVEESGMEASIFPDYAECTVPPNIAPMNFALSTPYDRATATFTSSAGEWSVVARGGQFTIPPRGWRKMLAAGGDISVRITALNEGRWIGYAPFRLHIAPEPIDPYIAYRLIEPGFEVMDKVGIYQRNIEGFRQSPILENSTTEGSCMNCHTFLHNDPDKMLLHLRGSVAATMIVDGGKIEKLNTKTPQTISALGHPAWHPAGRFVVCTVNQIRQGFHSRGPNRIEAYDNASDVVVYDTRRHEILTSPLLHNTDTFESFPAFSPDGKTLYFTSAPYVADPIRNYMDLRYSLCSIAFDPDTRSFGSTVDTLYNARTEGRSAALPRVSPDGRRLMYTLAGHNGYPLWQHDSDLWMIDLGTGRHYALEAANSPTAADSYHSWSSNSRWVLFSSRRLDGLHTRPFIAYVDSTGVAHKAFVVPQRDVKFYHRSMYSYNVPEFIKGKVKDRRREISRMAKNGKGIDVTTISVP